LKATSLSHSVEQQALYCTGRDLDVAIDGQGFFEVFSTSGEILYTRDGALQVDPKGHLMTRDGYLLTDVVTLPAHYKALDISNDGTVSVILQKNSLPIKVGSLHITTFLNQDGLQEQEPNYFVPTASSGLPSRLTPHVDVSTTFFNRVLEYGFTPLGGASREVQDAISACIENAISALNLS
jgi:flagellar basal-body rod protein FlgG